MSLSPHLYSCDMPHLLIGHAAQRLRQLYAGKPLEMAEALLLLPTHRACAAMRRALINLAPEATVLPRIQAIGEVEEGWSLSAEAPAMPPSVRQAHIARLLCEADGGEASITITEACAAAWEIAQLMDELDREMIAYDAVLSLKPDVYAQHWRKRLRGLHHVLACWPEVLARHQMQNPIRRRNAQLLALAEHWREQPPSHPVWAIGSTGSQPATAALLKVIASLPQGAVFLPQLDTQAGDALWQAITPSHPQWALHELLSRLGVAAADVPPVDAALCNASHQQLWREVMRPAALPQMNHEPLPEPFVHEVACASGDEEASAITLMLLEVAHRPGATAALITHDERLMERVEALLNAQGLHPNRAVGKPATGAPLMRWLTLVHEVAVTPLKALPLLSLLKHPWCNVLPAITRDAVLARLETECFRGVRRDPDIWRTLQDWLRQAELAPDGAAALETLAGAMEPLSRLLREETAQATACFALHLEVAQALAQDRFAPQDWLADIGRAMAALGSIPPHEYGGLLAALAAHIKQFDDVPSHPRLHMLSPIEARLLTFDRIILGGMTEGCWPQRPSDNSYLSDAMRRRVGLPNLQAHIGQQAHDFTSLAGGGEVIVTHARRGAGGPAMPSRWLQRMQAAGVAPLKAIHWRDWANDWLRPEAMVEPMPPAPMVAADALPRAIWATQMERLLRDPYGFYARHLLHLKKLGEIDEPPGPADYGQFVHRIWERFAQDEATPDAFARAVKHSLVPYDAWPTVQMMWRPRLLATASAAAMAEAQERALFPDVQTEVAAGFDLPVEGWAEPLRLMARIDRLSAAAQGAARVIDYKTGEPPSISAIELGYDCQLPLAARAAAVQHGSPVQAGYWHMKSGRASAPQPKSFMDEGEVQALADELCEGLARMMAEYAAGRRAFWPIPVPAKKPDYNDYEHLSRVAEWLAEQNG